MMAIGQAKNRAAGTSTAAMAELFRSMFAYSGKWSIDSKKFVTKVDLAADPGWVGTSQVRYYTSTGEHSLSERLPWSSQHFLGERPLSTRSGKRKVASLLLGARSSLVDADRAAEARLQQYPIARRQYPRRLVGADRDPCEQRGCGVVDPGGKVAQP